MKDLIIGEKNKDIQHKNFIIALVTCALETTCKQKDSGLRIHQQILPQSTKGLTAVLLLQ